MSVRVQGARDTAVYVSGFYASGTNRGDTARTTEAQSTSDGSTGSGDSRGNLQSVYNELLNAIIRKMKDRFGVVSEKIAERLAKEYVNEAAVNGVDTVADKLIDNLERALVDIAYETANATALKLLFRNSTPLSAKLFISTLVQHALNEKYKLLSGEVDIKKLVDKTLEFIKRNRDFVRIFDSERPDILVDNNNIVIEVGPLRFEIDKATLLMTVYHAAKARVIPVYQPMFMTVKIIKDDGSNIEGIVYLDRNTASSTPPPMIYALICDAESVLVIHDVRNWLGGALGWGLGVVGDKLYRRSVCDPDLACGKSSCRCSAIRVQAFRPLFLIDEYPDRKKKTGGYCGGRIEACFRDKYGGKAAAKWRIEGCGKPTWLTSVDIKQYVYKLSDKSKLLKILESKVNDASGAEAVSKIK